MKPSWKDAPEWAGFMAMNLDGLWCWFSDKPEYDSVYGIWAFGGKVSIASIDCLNLIDAAKSLEQRP